MESNQHLETKVNQIYIDTGNLLQSEQVKRQATLLPDEEAITGLNIAVGYWKSRNQLTTIENDSKLIISQCFGLPKEKIDPQLRENCKITVKLFIYDEIINLLDDALDFILKSLNTDYLDSLIIAIQSTGETKLTMDKIKRLWNCAEKIDLKQVRDIGLSDLDTPQLSELYQSAKLIKPSSNQINLESCCVIPSEMKEFAQNNNVKLLTHNDPKDFLADDKFRQLISSCGFDNPSKWSRFWIARYTSLQKHKGIVQNKGYILSAKKSS
ncbi:glutamate--cysteine ligase regulatory subunit-like [Panonychus citri]|uniref:glutamate--cysteine ligase regulatory subunit-like n=1 Tax=Panonychus citri TaxID=50023 RepID=UPI0023075638|nr:glutamate--cysteine ligase regulatory subunit-like [Panonychus citri]